MEISDYRKRQWPKACVRTSGRGVLFSLHDIRHVLPKPSLLRLDRAGKVSSDEDFASSALQNLSQRAANAPTKEIPRITSFFKMERHGCMSGLIQNPGLILASLSKNRNTSCQSRSGLTDHRLSASMNLESCVFPPNMDTPSDISCLGQECSYTDSMSMPQTTFQPIPASIGSPWLLNSFGQAVPGGYIRPPQAAMQQQRRHMGSSYMSQFGDGYLLPWLNCAPQTCFKNPENRSAPICLKRWHSYRKGRSPAKRHKSVMATTAGKQIGQSHLHCVPSVVNESAAVMDLHRSRSFTTVIRSFLYDIFVHSLILSVHIVLGLSRPLPIMLPSISNHTNLESAKRNQTVSPTVVGVQHDVTAVTGKVQDLSIVPETTKPNRDGEIQGDSGQVPADCCDINRNDSDVENFTPDTETIRRWDRPQAQLHYDTPGEATISSHEDCDFIEPQPVSGLKSHGTRSDAINSKDITHINETVTKWEGDDSKMESVADSCGENESAENTLHVCKLCPTRLVLKATPSDDELPSAPHEHAKITVVDQAVSEIYSEENGTAISKTDCRDSIPPTTRVNPQYLKKKKKPRPSSKKRRRLKLQRSDTQCNGTVHFVTRDVNKPATERLKSSEMPPACDPSPSAQNASETQWKRDRSPTECPQIKPLSFVVGAAESGDDSNHSKFAFLIHTSEISDSSESESEDSDCQWGSDGDEVDSAGPWNSLYADLLPSPLSVQFTCSITSLSPCEQKSPHLTASLLDANVKWNTSYGDTPSTATPEKVLFKTDFLFSVSKMSQFNIL